MKIHKNIFLKTSISIITDQRPAALPTGLSSLEQQQINKSSQNIVPAALILVINSQAAMIDMIDAAVGLSSQWRNCLDSNIKSINTLP